MSDELDIIDPQPESLTIDGEEMELRPLTVGRLPAFTRAIRPMMPFFQDGEFDVVDLLADHGEDLIAAVAIASGRPSPWIEALDPINFVELATAAIQVNMDFFNRRLVPAIQAKASALSAGLPSSSDSREQDTAAES